MCSLSLCLWFAPADAERADKFPWALGGYKNFPKAANLAPVHRRFMAENQIYVVLRIAPILFPTNFCVLLLCVVSYLAEAVAHLSAVRGERGNEEHNHAPPSAVLVPQTLMAVFASVVTYTCLMNVDSFIPATVGPLLLTGMQAVCGACWLCCLPGRWRADLL